MKAAEVDLLIIPDQGGADDEHWQSRWQRKLSTARRVEQDDWSGADRDAWLESIRAAVEAAERPVVFLAHGLGVAAVVHAAASLPAGTVAAAFFVAPTDVDDCDAGEADPEFGDLPSDPLPFPSMLVASRSDPSCGYARADDLGHAWGSFVIDAGEIGHANSASGHGPWPEGSLTFARFLSSIKQA